MDEFDNNGLVDIVTSTLDPCGSPDYFQKDGFPDFYLGPCYPQYEDFEVREDDDAYKVLDLHGVCACESSPR